jgi:hypothetical protein
MRLSQSMGAGAFQHAYSRDKQLSRPLLLTMEEGIPVSTRLRLVTDQLTEVEHINVIRSTIAIFCYGNHSPLNLLLGEALKTRCNKNIHHIASLSLTSPKSNPVSYGTRGG